MWAAIYSHLTNPKGPSYYCLRAHRVVYGLPQLSVFLVVSTNSPESAIYIGPSLAHTHIFRRLMIDKLGDLCVWGQFS